MKTCIPLLALALVLALPASALGADNVPATVVVKLGPLGAPVKAKGSLVPARVARVACEPERYSGALEIVEAAPEGPVVKGQVLVRFDETPYREQLEERERAFAAARIQLQKAELDARLKEAENATAMEEALRKKRLADEALARFEQVERKLLEESKIHAFEGRRIQIQNMREELAQLEKMYKEDDLTEETEEIVLKRTRRSFERSLESFERAKKRHVYDMEVDLPRRHETLRLAARKAAQGLERFQKSLPLDEAKRKLDLENARRQFAKTEEALTELRADAEHLTVKAPFAGYAARGTFADGAWKSLADAEDHEAGKQVKKGQTLFTVLDESELRAQATVPEAQVPHVRAGLAATVRTAATGKRAFEAELAVVARYGKGGAYAVTLRLKQTDPVLRAGMACTIEIPRAEGEDVLSVPAQSVQHTDEGDFVYVQGEDGPVKTQVEVGETVGGRVEIVSGVKAGMRVLAKPPSQAEAR